MIKYIVAIAVYLTPVTIVLLYAWYQYRLTLRQRRENRAKLAELQALRDQLK